MAISYAQDTATLQDICGVEEGGEFAEWLIADPARKVDLGPCTALHSSILQSLMALAPGIVALPQDPQLARWLGGILPHLAPAEPRPTADLPQEEIRPRPSRPRGRRQTKKAT